MQVVIGSHADQTSGKGSILTKYSVSVLSNLLLCLFYFNLIYPHVDPLIELPEVEV